MPSQPPSLPGTLSRPDAQRIIDALNLRLWEAEQKINALEVSPVFTKMVVAGAISAEGAVVRGEGFSASKTATGKYTITLTAELPTVGALTFGQTGGLVYRVLDGKKEFKIETFNTGGVLTNLEFDFMIKAT